MKNARKKPKVMPFVLGHLISTEEARGYVIWINMEEAEGYAICHLIMENNFDGRSNLNLNNEIIDNLNNTMID